MLASQHQFTKSLNLKFSGSIYMLSQAPIYVISGTYVHKIQKFLIPRSHAHKYRNVYTIYP